MLVKTNNSNGKVQHTIPIMSIKYDGKHVTFSPSVSIWFMHVWKFTYNSVRKCERVHYYFDNQRFQTQIAKARILLTRVTHSSLTGIMYPFNPCTTMTLSGTTGSGKTWWVRDLINNSHTMFPSSPPDRILYCYSLWQNIFIEMEKGGVEFHQGIPTEEYIDTFRNGRKHCLIILDDLMDKISKSTDVESLFTRGSHHKQLSVLYLNQNYYSQGKSTRTISINSHYVILFKTADISQILSLGKQMGLGKVVVEAYQDCMQSGVGNRYLVIDRAPNSDQTYQLRSKIFPGEDTIVYDKI